MPKGTISLSAYYVRLGNGGIAVEENGVTYQRAEGEGKNVSDRFHDSQW